VRAGQALADIETPELDQQIHQVQAELETARANEALDKLTAERWKKMLAAQSVSQQEADEKAAAYSVSQARVDAAQANLNRLKTLAAFRHVIAPFDGIVTARYIDVGNLIDAGAGGKGSELFRLADEHQSRIYVDVPQTDAGQITVGLAAQLELPELPGVQVSATVMNLSQAVNVASRTMQVELLADNPDRRLLPGKYVEVHFQIPAPAHVLGLPTTALIFRKEGLQVAMVDSTSHIVLKPIQIAQERGAVVDVKLGVTPQDRIVDSPPDSIANGDLVRPASAAAVTAAQR
jgi:RND family efflux transporter MFP subunit